MSGRVWALARRQHEILRHDQLRALGYTDEAIRHRVARGRLHFLYRGVYAVGTPHISRLGKLLAAVFACGPGAVLSHASAAWVWLIRTGWPRELEVTIPAGTDRRPPGIRVHRRSLYVPDDLTCHRDIPVTSPTRTLLDLATRLPARDLEAAINEADSLDLVDAGTLLEALAQRRGQPGVRPLRTLLERATFRLTDSELERRFLPIAARAGLPAPLTQEMVNGYRVDFHFPTLGLVVEADSLRYHRTAAKQTRDARRDQAHAAAGQERLRFTHFQIRYERRYVEAILRRVAKRRLGILDI
jgi:very-short-patch-repair endonuclease